MNALEALFYGRDIPSEMPPNSDYQVQLKQVIRREEELKAMLTKEQWLAWDAYMKEIDTLNDCRRQQAFEKGFALATNIMIEVMNISNPISDL